MIGKLRTGGTVVGLIGAALTGWALFTMFSSCSCVRTGAGKWPAGARASPGRPSSPASSSP